MRQCCPASAWCPPSFFVPARVSGCLIVSIGRSVAFIRFIAWLVLVDLVALTVVGAIILLAAAVWESVSGLL
jgi:hypothetical protein